MCLKENNSNKCSICNVYEPTNNKNNNNNNNESMDILLEVTSILQMYNSHDIIFGDDF